MSSTFRACLLAFYFVGIRSECSDGVCDAEERPEGTGDVLLQLRGHQSGRTCADDCKVASEVDFCMLNCECERAGTTDCKEGAFQEEIKFLEKTAECIDALKTSGGDQKFDGIYTKTPFVQTIDKPVYLSRSDNYIFYNNESWRIGANYSTSGADDAVLGNGNCPESANGFVVERATNTYLPADGCCRDGDGNFGRYLTKSDIDEEECKNKCDAFSGEGRCDAYDYNSDSRLCGVWGLTLGTADAQNGWTYGDGSSEKAVILGSTTASVGNSKCNLVQKKTCYIAYCNAHSDLQELFCGGKTCDTQDEQCRLHWAEFGHKEADRKLNPERCDEQKMASRVASPKWQCHQYENNSAQDDDWCSRHPLDAGDYEFMFTGGQNELFPGCGACSCCKTPKEEGCWSSSPGRWLAGYTVAGEECYSELEAKIMCLAIDCCNGINKQHDECGGNKWTLRTGKFAMSAIGYDASTMESQFLDRGCRDEEVNPPEEQRSYSSVHGDDAKGTGLGRSSLGSESSWAAKEATVGQWLSIDLGYQTSIAGAVTQGRQDFAQWMTALEASVSSDGSTWTKARSMFPANTDQNTKVVSHWAPVMGRYLKLTTQEFQDWPALRAGVMTEKPKVPLTGVSFKIIRAEDLPRTDGRATLSDPYIVAFINGTNGEEELCRTKYLMNNLSPRYYQRCGTDKMVSSVDFRIMDKDFKKDDDSMGHYLWKAEEGGFISQSRDLVSAYTGNDGKSKGKIWLTIIPAIEREELLKAVYDAD